MTWSPTWPRATAPPWPAPGATGRSRDRSTRGPRFEADGPTLAFLADLAARTIPGGLSRRGRARPGAVIRLRLGGREWLLGGAAGERPDPAAVPDLVLEADPLAFVLRAAGRTGGEPWRAEGDRALAADVAATLSSVS